MNYWLKSFAYRITISAWTFILSALLVSLIAAGTIAYQTFKTAVSNPDLHGASPPPDQASDAAEVRFRFAANRQHAFSGLPAAFATAEEVLI